MRQLIFLIRSDLYRYYGSASLLAFLRCYFLVPGFNYSALYRLCWHLRRIRSLRPLYLPLRFLLGRRAVRAGIDVSLHSDIGPGLYIGHYGGIIVGAHITIGRNCNISQGVTIGVTNRGKRAGYPTLGDNVYVAPGAKVIGGIWIGHDVAIGANSVVVCDVPDNAVVVGVPARVISLRGSAGYVNNRVE